jgi:hypothetical protein
MPAALGWNGRVGVTGNENDWRIDVAFPQETSEVNATHARHPVVDHQAIGYVHRNGVQ